MRTRPELLLVYFCSMMSSCSLFNPDEQVPGFIVIESLEFNSNFAQDTDSEKISEVWVFANSQSVGVFDLPATIPVLRSGETNISVRAGIKNNGIATTRISYPFYEPYDLVIDVQPYSFDTIIPEFTYKESANLVISDSFENGTLFTPTDASNVGIELVENEDSFEGSSGKVLIDGDNSFFEAETNEVPLNSGKQIWAELDYKCNNTFAIGLVAVAGDDESKSLALIVNPTTDENNVARWNKIYVELSFVANQFINAPAFRLYIESFKNDSGIDAELWFDNVKIVQFDS
jgi:hypothetical protein